MVTKSFLRDAASVAEAREFVRAALDDWNLPSLTDTAELVASELATNAVLHARCAAYRVTVTRPQGDQVRVAVTDRSRALPRVADPGDEDDHGRGLALVDAVAEKWGTDRLNWGKCVWVDLEAPPIPEPPVTEASMYGRRHAQLVYALILAAVAGALAVGMFASR
ncbi:ATP-binding protein [Streptomyces sp. NPDC048392]|uniref:ATP-binding protein n=1 Tax=Streptomyces sp. NPDC048392 TaxID=3365543 RepID=UPI0037129CB1